MDIREWRHLTQTPEQTLRMYQTKPGALALVIDQILYSFCDENGTSAHRGMILSLNNAERFYVGHLDKDAPQIDGRDGSYVHVRKALREVQHLLEAYALREVVR